MSQFSRYLAQQIIRSSAFLETLTDLMATEIENQLRAAAGGDRIYIPKTTSLEDKHTRNQMIRAQFTGANLDALAVRYSITVRQVRRIVAPFANPKPTRHNPKGPSHEN